MKSAGYKSAKEFSEKYTIPYLTFSQHAQGRRHPPDATLKLYSKAFKVSFLWLKTGEGNPLEPSAPTKKNQEKESFIEKTLAADLHKLQIVNTELLTYILEEVSKLKSKHKITEKKCALIAAHLYNEAVKASEKKESQNDIIRAAIKTYEVTL